MDSFEKETFRLSLFLTDAKILNKMVTTKSSNIYIKNNTWNLAKLVSYQGCMIGLTLKNKLVYYLGKSEYVDKLIISK